MCHFWRGRKPAETTYVQRPELCTVPEAVTPPACFVRLQNSSGTRSVKVLTRLWKLADVVRKIKQEGHKNHENKQNFEKKRKITHTKKKQSTCMAGGRTAAAEAQNKRPEPRLLKSGLRRDSGTQQRFPSGKP